jgi:hypothetical protein
MPHFGIEIDGNRINETPDAMRDRNELNRLPDIPQGHFDTEQPSDYQMIFFIPRSSCKRSSRYSPAW